MRIDPAAVDFIAADDAIAPALNAIAAVGTVNTASPDATVAAIDTAAPVATAANATILSDGVPVPNLSPLPNFDGGNVVLLLSSPPSSQ